MPPPTVGSLLPLEAAAAVMARSIKETASLHWGVGFGGWGLGFGVRNEVGPVEEQLLHRNVKRFQGGLESKAHRLLYHSTLGSRVIKKKRRLGPL